MKKRTVKMTKETARDLITVHAMSVEAFWRGRRIVDMPAEIQGLVRAVRRWKKML